MNTTDLLIPALEATDKACIEILSVYHTSDFDVELKSDDSPLTRADRQAHKAIVAELASTGLPVLSEEGKATPYAERKNWGRFWMVDPLDGTKEFIKRNGEFTVNIALIENGKPVLGVVAVPVTGEIYFGAPGMGAIKRVNGMDTKLSVRKDVNLKAKGLRVVASRSHSNEETQAFIDSLREPVLVSKGSSLKFMMLADGRADIYPRFAPTMEWDTAAAHAIVNQCGFAVTQAGTQQELTYNKEALLNPHFFVV